MTVLLPQMTMIPRTFVRTRMSAFGAALAVLALLTLVVQQVLQANALICPNASQPVRRRASYGALLPATPLRIQVGDVEYVCYGDVLRPDRLGIDSRCPARDKLMGSKITLNNHDRKSHCVVRTWRDTTLPSVVLVTISPEIVTMQPTDDGIPVR